MLYDLRWTFCFTIYDSRLLRNFLISYLLTCTGVTCLCVPMLFKPFSMHVFRFRFIDIHVVTWFRIYFRCFNFLYVTCHCLYLHAWITSLDHAHMCLPEHANWPYHMYSLGCILTTLDFHVQILESGPWWSCCSWPECAADPFVTIRTQQKLGHYRSSSSQLFSWLALEASLSASEQLSAFVIYISSYNVLLYFLVM